MLYPINKKEGEEIWHFNLNQIEKKLKIQNKDVIFSSSIIQACESALIDIED